MRAGFIQPRATSPPSWSGVDFPATAAGAKLARSTELFTERFVSRTLLTAALLLGLASGVSAQTAAQTAAPTAAPTAAQPTTNDNVPRATYIATMDAEYSKMDGDKNGKVTRAEIETFDRAVALGQARMRAQALFARLDADRNGQLSAAEFGKMVSGSPQVDGRPLLGKLDTNKDGTVSLVEHRGGKLAYFDQIDTDKDGVVTVVEMKAAGVIK